MNRNPGLAAWLTLAHAPGLGAGAVRRLLKEFGLPEAVLSARRSELERFVPAPALQGLDASTTRSAVERSLDWASSPGRYIIPLSDPAYPRLLYEIPDPPTLLFARGRLELADKAALAVVGSRNATPQGLANAESFAKSLSAAGLAVVSGLALGIDTAAHRGGLAGAGSTLAVLGTGVDVSYPARNTALAEEIAVRGLLISEFPLGTPPVAHNFPRRNRLISGMSRGVLVVEAAIASGSLITARTAIEQGREVFAIPGSIHSPLAKGCHALIKAGAKLVDSVEDVLSELGAWQTDATARAPDADHEDESSLLAYIGFDPVDFDSLCARAGLPAERVSAQLLRLELDGRIAALPGGRYQRLN
ncbi:MAG: DNA-protecting protein DprA [Betaproteobacteria bacterium]|nr:DNA-protecting protein DprA [Betaproteobacteria bacterium]